MNRAGEGGKIPLVHARKALQYGGGIVLRLDFRNCEPATADSQRSVEHELCVVMSANSVAPGAQQKRSQGTGHSCVRLEATGPCNRTWNGAIQMPGGICIDQGNTGYPARSPTHN